MKTSSTTYQTHNGYELSDLPIVIGISNTRVVLTDRRVSTYTSGFLTSVSTDISSWSDYFSFGWEIPGRTFSLPDSRYTFNGKELDREWDRVDFEARPYNRKTGRFEGGDPKGSLFPAFSPYSYFSNNPIYFLDRNGEDGIAFIDKKNQRIVIVAFFNVDTKSPQNFPSNLIKLQRQVNSTLNLNASTKQLTEGQYKKYTVQFALKFKDGGSNVNSKEIRTNLIVTKDKGSRGGNISNSIKSTPNIKTDNKEAAATTENDNIIRVKPGNFFPKWIVIHEIWHTLFFDQDGNNTGIGYYPGGAPPTLTDYNQLINGGDKNVTTIPQFEVNPKIFDALLNLLNNEDLENKTIDIDLDNNAFNILDNKTAKVVKTIKFDTNSLSTE